MGLGLSDMNGLCKRMEDMSYVCLCNTCMHAGVMVEKPPFLMLKVAGMHWEEHKAFCTSNGLELDPLVCLSEKRDWSPNLTAARPTARSFEPPLKGSGGFSPGGGAQKGGLEPPQHLEKSVKSLKTREHTDFQRGMSN